MLALVQKQAWPVWEEYLWMASAKANMRKGDKEGETWTVKGREERGKK